MNVKKRVLVFGVTGMLGHVLFRSLSGHAGLDVRGTVRSREGLSSWFSPDLLAKVQDGVDAVIFDSVLRLLDEVKPDVVINCIGIIKQLKEAKDPVASISLNSLFPHKLASACRDAGARLIHISTDCVFSGAKGMYREDDRADDDELYGRTKLLGEVSYPHTVTLRTSIIGHELRQKVSLVEWFLAQHGKVKGYTKAIYSGFPTIELSGIIAKSVIPSPALSGLYHVSSEPISKYELLKLIARQYGKEIGIEPYDGFSCDRSLDSTRFRQATGYAPPPWEELVARMHADYRAFSPYRA